jgi:mRNA interferase MazF
VPSRGEVWWAFDGDRIPVVILPRGGEAEIRVIQVVAPADTDISGVAIELSVGVDEGVPSGVVRVALARPGQINCAWVLSVDESDLVARAGALSQAKFTRLAEMLTLGDLD